MPRQKKEAKRCSKNVYTGGYSNSTTQCSRKANAGGKFCTQHDPTWVKKKHEEKYKNSKSQRDNEERIHKFKNAACLFVKRLANEGVALPVLRAQEICREHGIDYEK